MRTFQRCILYKVYIIFPKPQSQSHTTFRCLRFSKKLILYVLLACFLIGTKKCRLKDKDFGYFHLCGDQVHTHARSCRICSHAHTVWVILDCKTLSYTIWLTDKKNLLQITAEHTESETQSVCLFGGFLTNTISRWGWISISQTLEWAAALGIASSALMPTRQREECRDTQRSDQMWSSTDTHFTYCRTHSCCCEVFYILT